MPNHGMQQHEMFKVEASNTSSGSSQRLTYGKSHQGPCFTLAALAARNLPGRSLSGGFGLCTKLGHWLCVNPSRKDLGESAGRHDMFFLICSRSILPMFFGVRNKALYVKDH